MAFWCMARRAQDLSYWGAPGHVVLGDEGTTTPYQRESHVDGRGGGAEGENLRRRKIPGAL